MEGVFETMKKIRTTLYRLFKLTGSMCRSYLEKAHVDKQHQANLKLNACLIDRDKAFCLASDMCGDIEMHPQLLFEPRFKRTLRDEKYRDRERVRLNTPRLADPLRYM